MIRHALAAALALGAASPAIAQTKPPSPSGIDDNRLICRKIDETGSLVRKQKHCFTKAEWDRIAESQRRGTVRMIDELTSKQGG
ncbi:hypothetical protein ACFOMD_11835 [Sphingoaurantiacus capsulatus]|uniref:Uncharacterized protein n=1 Tax=Sphingoaurantiacus capsulatus TaxID=1771310 RepID=A0ABV7XAY7_9SPHN